MTDGLDEIIAGLGYSQGEPSAADSAPPASPPPSLVAAESEQASDAPTSPEPPVEASEPEQEAVAADDPEALKARLAEIESELKAERDAKEQARREAEQRTFQEQQLAAWKAQQEEEQRSQQFADDLANVDPQMRDAYQQVRTGLTQQRDQAWTEAAGLRHGFTAFAKAVESELSPEQFQAIAAKSESLVTLRSEQEMDQTIAQQKQSAESQRTATLKLEKENAELRLRIDAMTRPPQADAVDAGSTGGAGGADWQERPDFDGWFAGLETTLPWAQ